MATMEERMLEQATELVERYPRSSAARRRAVSSAYDAAFHRLLRTCASTRLAHGDPGSTEFERVYRALDHGTVKNAFSGSPLKKTAALGAIGTDSVQLRDARLKADDTPPRRTLFTAGEAIIT